jgi:glycosyltransferase involved in cell wall biosynthesis
LEEHIPPSPRGAHVLRKFSRRPSARAVLTITRYTAAHLEAAGVPADKLHVLPDAAELSAFTDLPTQEDARRQLGLPLDRQIIGYVGRFVTLGREKGVRDLIHAVAAPELRALDPLLLCVGGPGDVVADYQDLARSLGVPPSSIRFVDHVRNPEIPTWMAALDIGAVPAPGAGDGLRRDAALDHYGDSTSPLKLFEYMAAGLPIVAADLAGISEVIDDGENGLLVRPGDTDALAAACRRILEDGGVARALGDRARRDASRYGWDQRAERALASALRAPPRAGAPTSGT